MRRLIIFAGFIFFIQYSYAQPASLTPHVIRLLDSFCVQGLIKDCRALQQLKYGMDTTQNASWQESASFRVALLAAKELSGGTPSYPWVGYDAISSSIKAARQDQLRSGLEKVQDSSGLYNYFRQLEPATVSYLSLKAAYQYHRIKAIQVNNYRHSDTAAWLYHSINTFRWIHHFQFDSYIIVNLAAAELSYYENGKALLQMKTIVGKPSTPSPRFAAWCEQVILYPYWYVPASIAIGEYLSKIKRNPSWLDQRNMQVVDANGRVVNHHQLNWKSFNAGYFPYTIRQSTGCDNALGVLKFDINTPYGVYLHDTNSKGAFVSNYRYLSHGCIRLEEPLSLGGHLLRDQLDTNYLQSCYKDQKPVYRKLEKPIPVFSVYLLASFEEPGKLRYHKDVYHLMGRKNK